MTDIGMMFAGLSPCPCAALRAQERKAISAETAGAESYRAIGD
jgi:hypothetical protein